jgi:hypothetical protein
MPQIDRGRGFAASLARSKSCDDRPPPPSAKGVRQYASEVIDWCGGVLKGDFAENPSVGQTVARSLLTMIPGVDQGGDIQDLSANLLKCYKKGRIDASDGLAIALTAIGAIPELGSALKGSLKILLKAADELTSGKAGDAVAIARKLFALPMVRKGVDTFLARAGDMKANLLSAIGKALNQIAALHPQLAAFIASKRADILRAAGSGFDQLRQTIGDTRDRLAGKPAAPKPKPAPQTLRTDLPDRPKPPATPAKPAHKQPFDDYPDPMIRNYSWGQSLAIDSYGPAKTAEERARYILHIMERSGAEQIVVPKGGDKGAMMAALQRLGNTEFLLVRTKAGSGAGERLLVRGDHSNVSLPTFGHAPIAHTHPPSRLSKIIGAYAGVMPSAADIHTLRSSGYTSSMIINGDGLARRHHDFGQILENPTAIRSLGKLSATSRIRYRQRVTQQQRTYNELISLKGNTAMKLPPSDPRHGEMMKAMHAYIDLYMECDAIKRMLDALPPATH